MIRSGDVKKHGLVGLATLCCGVVWAAPVMAQPAVGLAQRTFTLSQPGQQAITNVPIVRTASTAVDFYDYFSASSHTGVERNKESTLFLHYDISTPDEPISLIITHGIDETTSGEVQPTARVDMDIDGLPTSTAVTFSDDGNEFTKPTNTTAVGGWAFGRNTDGGVLGGFPQDEDWEITIEIDNASLRGMDRWTYRDPLGTDYEIDFAQPFTITYDAPETGVMYDVEVSAGSPLELCGAIESSNGMNSTYSFDWNNGAQTTSGTTTMANDVVCDTFTFTQPGEYEVELTADDGTGAGTATVTVRVLPPCGDGIVRGTEACDDGNSTSGDGCSDTCAVEIGYACMMDATTVTNGSFEAPVIASTVAGNTVPDDWQGSNIDITRTGGTQGVAPDGLQLVDLNAGQPGVLFQDIATVVGQRYTVTFQGAYNSTGGDPGAVGRVTAAEPGSPAHSQKVIASTVGFNELIWDDFEFTFAATSTTTRLQFNGMQPTSAYGLTVDNVVLQNSVCTPIDDDMDGILSIDEDLNGNGDLTDDDTDGDLIPNYLDTDDDGDTVLTEDEDTDNDGNPANDLGANGPRYLDPCDPDDTVLACPTADSDGDGIANGVELVLGTMPDNADSDGDGLCDGVATVMGVCVDGEDAEGGQNSDMDLLIDALDSDDDGDGVPTADEDLNADGDPVNDDTDGDTIPNYLDTDDDGDTVLTEDEDTNNNGNPGDDLGANGPRYLDPCDPDADALACPTGDPDGDGVPNATDPEPENACVPNPDAVACPTGDPDGDGVPNDMDPGPLDACNPDPNDPLCDSGDTDGDGITNGVETAIGTLPDNADTDGDGLCDGTIAVAGVCVAGEDAVGGQNSDTDMLLDALDSDDDGDGIPTADEDLNGDDDPSNDNTDGDALPNYLDADDDGDGVLSINEDTNNDGNPANDLGANGPRFLDPCEPNADAVACPTGDADGDDEPNGTDPDPLDPCNPDPNDPLCDSGDTDGDGITNGVETTLGTSVDGADTDGDGLCDGTIAVAGVCVAGEDAEGGQNSDTDMLLDALDSDDDGDGVPTADEDVDADGDPTNDNTDGDTLPNYLDADDDGDGILTLNEDINGNGDPTDDNSDRILGDNLPNYLDPDDDGDGVDTADEDADPNDDGDPADAVDTSMNGFADYLDPCTPDDQGRACLSGDTDGDGFSNDPNDDPEPLNPCVPDADALACPTGDPDMDGISNEDEATYMTNPENDDSDGDGVPDNIEIGDDANDPLDTDDDGIINALDDDDDGDGIPTREEDIDADGDPTNDDSDTNDVPNYLDNDDDGDGILTLNEDVDGDGNPINDNTDGDTLPNYLDNDDDGDGVLTVDEDVNADGDLTNDNTDGDTLPNYLDADDDGDGILTTFELGDDAPASFQDTDEDLTPDYLDNDDDGDNVLTIDESADPDDDGDPSDALDANSNDLPDYLDPETPGNTDDGLTLTAPADGATVPGDFTVSGQAAPGSTVEIFIGGEKAGEATADDEGNWSFDVTGQADGSLDIEARQGDDSAQITVTVDEAAASDDVTITSPVENEAIVAAEGADTVTVTVEGQAAPGSTVEIFVDGEKAGEATADADGNWSAMVDVSFGMHDVAAQPAGDEDARSPAVSFTAQAAEDMTPEDEFKDLVLSGGCQQTPGGKLPLNNLAPLALLGLLGLARRKKRDAS